MTDPTELRRLAEAATPGPWMVSGGWVVSSRANIADCSWAWDRVADQPHMVADDLRYIAVMHPQTTLALLDEINELRSAVVTFCGPWAVEYAQRMALPPKHLHPVHYDLLAKCGARMIDFVRHDND